VVEAEKVEDIEEAEAMEDSQEDSKAREAGTQPVQVPNNPGDEILSTWNWKRPTSSLI
jgi:hypothetical protein